MRIGVSAFVWDSQLTSAHIDLIPKLKAYGLDGFEIPIFDPTNLAPPDLHRTLAQSRNHRRRRYRAASTQRCVVYPPVFRIVRTSNRLRLILEATGRISGVVRYLLPCGFRVWC